MGYLDDDARVPSEWLSVATEIAIQKASAAFGGPYYTFYDRQKPKWFKMNANPMSMGWRRVHYMKMNSSMAIICSLEGICSKF
jgi:hypothetical protein